MVHAHRPDDDSVSTAAYAGRLGMSPVPRYVPARVDGRTIGVIPILATTDTGEFAPIEEIDDRVVADDAEHDLDKSIHVDAASGGSVAPFLHPDLRWDFRLPQVKSINASPASTMACCRTRTMASV